MKTVTKYEAFDGETFATQEECAAHEASCVQMRLIGLSLEQVEAAIKREDAELADAIEAVGAKIARARRESGELRRERRKSEPTGEPLAPGSL
jgi:hypothetical protein